MDSSKKEDIPYRLRDLLCATGYIFFIFTYVVSIRTHALRLRNAACAAALRWVPSVNHTNKSS